MPEYKVGDVVFLSSSVVDRDGLRDWANCNGRHVGKIERIKTDSTRGVRYFVLSLCSRASGWFSGWYGIEELTKLDNITDLEKIKLGVE